MVIGMMSVPGSIRKLKMFLIPIIITQGGHAPSSVIYGPNASGKSNLIRALHFMKNFILTSAQGQEGHAIVASPFSFSRASLSQPSEFEVIFIAEGVRYQYGFSVSLERVEHEWQLAYPQGRVQRWFERIYDHSKKQ